MFGQAEVGPPGRRRLAVALAGGAKEGRDQGWGGVLIFLVIILIAVGVGVIIELIRGV